MPRLDDAISIQHLIEAAEKAVAFAAGRDRAALDEDELLRLGLVKLVEIIGEVPWSAAARMRDRLVHHAAKQVSEPTRLAHPAV
jgi:uncharacterized protein with HEPN domain